MANPTHQQSSSVSVAYVLLGGFVVAVGLILYSSRVLGHLIAVKYNLIALVIKERVRYKDTASIDPNH